MASGTQAGWPPDTAIAPNDTPTTPSARHTSPISRSSGRSSAGPGPAAQAPLPTVRQNERTAVIMNTWRLVRQHEQVTGITNSRWEPTHGGTGRPAPDRPHRGLDPPRARAHRAVAVRAGQKRRCREVHAVTAGVRHRQPEPGDALGAERGPGRAVQPPGRPAV